MASPGRQQNHFNVHIPLLVTILPIPKLNGHSSDADPSDSVVLKISRRSHRVLIWSFMIAF